MSLAFLASWAKDRGKTEMKKIQLNHEEFALVDDDDYEFINQWKWRVDKNGYASRTQYLGGGKKNQKQVGVYMHKLINKTPDGFHTDHINRNKLDNRKCNLRTTTASQNLMNTGLSKVNTSGYKGVSWYAKAWHAEIKANSHRFYLGRFKKKEDAIKARQDAELKYHKICPI